jgi:hypothetical protein
MAQLGTLTAGLAHELNNPASAVQRAAVALEEAVDAYATRRAALGRDLPPAVAPLLAQASDPKARPRLDPIARSDAESVLEEWLEASGIADPWICSHLIGAASITPPATAEGRPRR